MSRKTFLYFLFSKNKLPLYKSDNGTILEGNVDYLKPDNQPAHLEYSPDGWKDTLVKFVRNIKNWGVFRDMAVPMKFVKDGADILKDQRSKFGYEAQTFLGMQKLDRTTLPYDYKPWYLSEINYTKYKETSTGVQVEALEGGPSKYLKAYENTKYEIPITEDPEHIKIYNDGMSFDFNRTISIIPGQKVIGANNFYLGTIETSREGNAPDVFFQDLFELTPGSVFPNDNWAIKTEIPLVNVRIHGTINIHFNKSVIPIFRLEIPNSETGAEQPQILLFNNGGVAGVAGTDIVGVFDFTINIPANYQVHLKIFGGSSTDFTTQFTVEGGEVLVDYVYRYIPTIVEALLPFRVGEKIVEKLTGGRYTLQSNFLHSKRDIALTCGDALRSLENSVLQSSLSDLFKSLGIFWIGMGIEGDKIVIEPWEYFFRQDIIIDLGEVKDADYTVAEDLLFNTISTGFEKQEYQDVNGRYETNQGQSWATPVTKNTKELDLKSVYRADPLGAELLRINFEKKKTTDTGSDKDVFMIHINNFAEPPDADGNIYYKLYRPAFDNVTGLPHWETSFNTLLSPKRTILNHGAFIRSMLEKMDGELITFTSADKNKELSVTWNGVTVTEKEDIRIATLPDRIFQPYYFTFTTQVPINFVELANINPYGKIRFTWKGRQWTGFLFEAGIKPGTNDTQTWKLLVSIENDLLKFNL